MIYPVLALPQRASGGEMLERWTGFIWSILDTLDARLLDMEAAVDKPTYFAVLRWHMIEDLEEMEIKVLDAQPVNVVHLAPLALEYGMPQVFGLSAAEVVEGFGPFSTEHDGGEWLSRMQAICTRVREELPVDVPHQRGEDSNVHFLQMLNTWSEAFNRAGVPDEALQAIIASMLDDYPRR